MHPILLHLGPFTFDIPAYLIGAVVGLIAGAIAAQSLRDTRRTALIGAAAGSILGVIIALAMKGTDSIHVKDWEPRIHTFGPLVALGAFLGILSMRAAAKKRDVDPEVITSFSVEVLLAGVAGSRALYCIITPESFREWPDQSWFYNHVLQYLAVWNGGLVWYGGLVSGGIYALYRARQLEIPINTMGDILAPGIMFGLAVGRIGCLMAGDDHGRLIESGPHWWTLTFPMDDDTLVNPRSLKGQPLYPAQPHMMIGAFLVGLACHYFAKKHPERPGSGMVLMGVLYPIHRFIVEFFRGDAVRKFVIVSEYLTDPETKKPIVDADGNMTPIAGLSTSQAISIPIAILCTILLVRKLRAPAPGPQPIPPSIALHPPASPEAPKETAPASVVATSPAAPPSAAPKVAPLDAPLEPPPPSVDTKA